MADKDKAATPLVEAYEAERQESRPAPIDTDGPVSTDTDGDKVDKPDLGGKID